MRTHTPQANKPLQRMVSRPPLGSNVWGRTPERGRGLVPLDRLFGKRTRDEGQGYGRISVARAWMNPLPEKPAQAGFVNQ
jgi:hypothetical protein